MYDEIFNRDDFEGQLEDNREVEIDIEFPTPKERPSLDDMLRKYGFIVFKEWTKTNQEVKKK